MPYLDIIFFAAIAAYIFFRLRNTLGRKDGGGGVSPRSNLHAPGARGDNVAAFPKAGAGPQPAPVQPLVEEPEIASNKVKTQLDRVKKVDGSFTPGQFLAGAKMAFEMALEAFSNGDKAILKNLLTPSVYEEFSNAIDVRAKKKTQEETTLVSIASADILGASLKGSKAQITVAFRSEQISVTKDEDGKIVEGNPSQIDTIEDTWVFERDLSSRDPNWTVIST